MLRTKRLVAVVMLCGAIGTGVASCPAAFAADSAVAVFDQVSWNRTKVRRLADLDARSEVRVAAWTALVSGNSDYAIEMFLAPGGGFEQAKARSAQNVARNSDIIRRVLATTTSQSSPAVHAAANRAAHGTIGEQDLFVRTGLDEARARDEDSNNQHDAEVAKQAQADRDYVAVIAVDDPGPWVREAAKRASRSGTDADIAEFFKYGWDSAARCDAQAFRIRITDQDGLWQVQLTRLIETARAAESALANAEGAARDKAKAVAADAWRAVSGQASAAQQGWEAEQVQAVRQAGVWREVAEFARNAATQQDWQTILDRAGSTERTWADERVWAEAQAQQWKSFAEKARESENRVAAS